MSPSPSPPPTSPPPSAPAGAAAAVVCRGVTKVYAEDGAPVQALRGVDLEARQGELLLLMGPSGCGKTTLLSVVAGVLDATQGSVSVLGEDVTAMTDGERTAFRRRTIGFIFQQYNLLPTLSAVENAAVPLLIQGVHRRTALERARAALDDVGLGERPDALPRSLSGGQQQRIAIARALVSRPRLLVCDEPTANLDGATGARVLDLLRRVAVAPDRCVLLVTHDTRVLPYGDRVAEMLDGRIVAVRAAPRPTPS